MLIEFFGKVDSNGSFSWYIPKLTLDRRFNYKVGLHHLNFKFLENTQNINRNELFCVTSNLVDLSSRNPFQSLFNFAVDGVDPISNIKPPIVTFHPVELYEIENSSFAIRNYFEDKEIKLSQIFLQVEILRLDSYGRIQ